MKIHILTALDIRKALPMPQAIAGKKQVFAQFSSGNTTVPLRTRIDIEEYEGITLVIPSLVHQTQGMAVKIVSVFPDKPQVDLPTLHAAVLVLNTATGAPVALLEGAPLTAIRTGISSDAETDLFA